MERFVEMLDKVSEMVLTGLLNDLLLTLIYRLLDKLESLDDNLENIRVDLNVAKVEVRRAQQLIERQDAV